MNQFHEVMIAGSQRQLLRLADAITRRTEAPCDPRHAEGSPYPLVLTSIQVHSAPSGRATVRVDADRKSLVIAGDDPSLSLFAQNVVGLATEGTPGDHQHIEYFPDHLWIEEGSDPLVVELLEEA